MWNVLFRHVCASAIFLVAGAGYAAADGFGRETGVLSHAGQAVEVRGLSTRVIAFYEGGGDQIALTILLSGGNLGGEIIRSHMPMRDGQRHALIAGGAAESGARERFSFIRRGSDVRVVFEPVGAQTTTRVGSASPSDAAPGPAETRVAGLTD
ncbi:hypothetical protein H0I76_08965 [Limibaculum sp. M0105]|uniref:Uncharacterized protein n=1 Tax=Thermohalobaculum xanthum TaxID=2753746 RepID=A0A8J7SGX7_9RHOB|nr:hypothetical protein [Thermohalobaculum xanthum]MBK0399320.1 hypothetical protein [Thermohalobaculum xanthum]